MNVHHALLGLANRATSNKISFQEYICVKQLASVLQEVQMKHSILEIECEFCNNLIYNLKESKKHNAGSLLPVIGGICK